MEYYLDYYSFWKYYLLLGYYWLAGYPPVIRFCAGFFTFFILLTIGLFVLNHGVARKKHRAEVRTANFRNKYYDLIKSIAIMPETLSLAEVSSRLSLPKNVRIKRARWEAMVPVFRELFVDSRTGHEMNTDNWRFVLQSFKMPAYFEMELRSSKMKRRLDALKDVSDISCDLKEAAASRYLYSKNAELRLSSRLHAARYGVSMPFKIFTEDAAAEFTEEMSTKLHWVLTYRKALGLSLPNFVRWMITVESSDSFRLFAINEIRLFHNDGDCEELLSYLKKRRKEEVAIAIIRTLGELKYAPAEQHLIDRYVYAGANERIALAEALGSINSGKQEVAQFLMDDYRKATDTVTKVRLLNVLYNYGTIGREGYNTLRSEAPAYDKIVFSHIECEYIDSRKYA